MKTNLPQLAIQTQWFIKSLIHSLEIISSLRKGDNPMPLLDDIAWFVYHIKRYEKQETNKKRTVPKEERTNVPALTFSLQTPSIFEYPVLQVRHVL